MLTDSWHWACSCSHERAPVKNVVAENHIHRKLLS